MWSGPDGTRELRPAPGWPLAHRPPRDRRALAAAHVAARRGADGRPEIDWEATLHFRDHLWSLGFAVAEAMDTAQRGMGLDWPRAATLIRRSAEVARSRGAVVACGAGTDQLTGADGLDAVVDAYLVQVGVVEEAGGQVILMASRALAGAARDADDYLDVYTRVLAQISRPVILHWLGPMFDPALAGYWGSTDLDAATATVLQLLREQAARIDGIKVSLLDADREIALRRALPPGVRLYTGDDFNYPRLIRGDEHGHSDALLGIFAAIAPPAAAALAALDRGEVDTYDAIMGATVPLARHIFGAPTYDYKTGIAFLAWLNGHQDEFVMIGDAQRRRSPEHLQRLVELADDARVLLDPELAARRCAELLVTGGS